MSGSDSFAVRMDAFKHACRTSPEKAAPIFKELVDTIAQTGLYKPKDAFIRAISILNVSEVGFIARSVNELPGHLQSAVRIIEPHFKNQF